MRHRFLAAALAPALAATAPTTAQCQLEKVLPSDHDGGMQFGDAVAADGVWMVVGASRDDSVATDAGAAYVFEDQGSGWVEVQKLVPPELALGDLFGWSVDLDVDAPGGPVLVVGAYLHDGAVSNGGGAWVYRLVGDTWTFEQALLADDAAPGDELGRSVAIDDDLVVLGAMRADDGDTINAGAAYVFHFDGVEWMQAARLTLPDAVDEDRLGNAVDVDADASAGPVVVAGAALADVAGAFNAGAVGVWRGSFADPLAWTHEQTLIDPLSDVQDRAGQSVAVRNGLVAVGISQDDPSGLSNAGSVLLWAYSPGPPDPWLDFQRLLAPDALDGDALGESIEIGASLDPPLDLLVVGALGVDAPGLSSGAVYLFVDDGTGWAPAEARLEALDAAAGDGFGTGLGVTEDVIVIGARGDDDDVQGSNAGSVYSFSNVIEACTDCNENLIADQLEILGDPSLDCDLDGVLDVCQISSDSPAPGGPFFCEEDCDPDCNLNGIPDSCDIDSGASDDQNANGIPDDCEDCNDNGILDELEIDGPFETDCNDNGILDSCEIADATETDCNGNGLPDSCDLADGGGSIDCDGDGLPDECGLDCNGNGVADSCDIDPADPDGDGEVITDLDGNGVPDDCQNCNENELPDFIELEFFPELDCNDNGIIDDCEIAVGTPASGGPFYCQDDCDPDCNLNGIPDSCDIDSGFAIDLNGNGVPDDCEDCNDNGIPDEDDIAQGDSEDCDGDGTPDECQIDQFSQAPGGPFFCVFGCDPDCNDNGIPDACDIDSGASEDCDGNGVPDECDGDCNGNGVPDACDVDPSDPDGDGQVYADFDGDGEPDVCAPDCNESGIPDFLEILLGLLEDENGNGVPDVCETIGDLDGDGDVDFEDLVNLLAGWGDCPPPPDPCKPDLDGDGDTDFEDLLILLSNWS